MLLVRPHMSLERPDIPERPDRRISWSVFMAIGAVFALAGGAAAPFIGPLSFGLAICLAAVTGFVVNRVRPHYDIAVGRWRSLYDFLLKQMPPPD